MRRAVLIFMFVYIVTADPLLHEHKYQLEKYKTFYIQDIQCKSIKTHFNDGYLVENISITFNGLVAEDNKQNENRNFIKYEVEAQIAQNVDNFTIVKTLQQNEISDESIDITNNILQHIIERCMNFNSNQYVTDSLKINIEPQIMNETIDLSDNYSVISEAFNILNETDVNRYDDQKDSEIQIIKNLLDGILRIVKKKITKKTNGFVDLPNIEKRKDSTHYMAAYAGKFWNLSTIERVEDYVIENNETTKIFNLNAVLGISNSNVAYKFEVKYGILWRPGQFHVYVQNFRLKFFIELYYFNTPCSLQVKRIQTDFSDISIDLIGFGPLNGVISRYARDSVLDNKQNILSYLDDKIQQLLQNAINTSLECEKIKFIFLQSE